MRALLLSPTPRASATYIPSIQQLRVHWLCRDRLRWGAVLSRARGNKEEPMHESLWNNITCCEGLLLGIPSALGLGGGMAGSAAEQHALNIKQLDTFGMP